ncbi:hypothetical protein [Mycolicibacterium fortuitum]|uniref:VirB8 protein n=2 Tax=Mycolicibacterium fortuitum TaxID=1766 RepID=A0AAE5AET5_MYCFO|nr:hypothetical protein [Mycolicibacterium fortuitum]MCV7139760.1 hypothetical protein [Mycolicibacterium fortuitum]MDV7192929.1 hypothetical protein [Mycolicibacterium fortuitum]MDV7206196.1 hypothetical protein [Mycolicibacterium fortuitum]MDV7227644.1 hypothetical protein [Mycolicibacterium fortuitum]MDV7260075.1 hypothetical protein [Mycolicibacterium fortuitum]
MPSRKPSSPVLDTSEDDASPSDALKLAEQAEAEAAEAEAVAAAARARAKAIRLRNEAAAEAATDIPEAHEDADEAADEESTGDPEDTAEVVESEATEITDTSGSEGDTESKASGRMPRVQVSSLFWKVLASCLTLILIVGLLVLSGLMIWHHRQAEHREKLTAEYTAAARQTVVTLMSLDFNHAQDAVKNILDNSTGEFREDFEAQSKDFVKLAQDAKVVTEANVTGAAVDSMSDDKAVVLVAVNTKVTNTTGANKQPRPWRVAVDLVREGDQIKLSKVEFVP